MLRSVIILTVVLSATLVFAQDASTGAIGGTVRDASSSTIQNATLVAFAPRQIQMALRLTF